MRALIAASILIVGRGPEASGVRSARANPAVESQLATAAERAVRELAEWVASQRGQLGAAVIDVRTGRGLAEYGADALLNPASNQKVLTAAAALKQLGTAYRYRTGLYGDVAQGHAKRLVLRGHGDPSLEVADLSRLARAVVGMGLARVDEILVDQSRFDEKFVPPAFDQQPNEWASFRAPISAVAVAQNTLTLNVLPTEPGKPARVWFEPPGAVDVQGAVRTAEPGQGQRIGWSLRPDGLRLKAALSGHHAAGLPRVRFTRRVDDPRALAGYALEALLEELDVRVGRVGLGGEGEKHRLTYVESAPLGVLLHRVGKNSDNFYAEMLLKTLGGEASGVDTNATAEDAGKRGGATSQDGAREVEAWMKSIGAHAPGMIVRNGSGLFDANRVSARALATALRAAYRDVEIGTAFVSQLAISGVDGTLRARFREHRYVVRAKTGTLNDVVALSGFVLAPNGASPVAFSFIVQGLPGKHHASRQRIDRAVHAIIGAVSAPS